MRIISLAPDPDLAATAPGDCRAGGRVEAGIEEFLYRFVPRAGCTGGAGEDLDPGVGEACPCSSCLNLANGDRALLLPAGEGLVGLVGEAGDDGCGVLVVVRGLRGGPVPVLSGGGMPTLLLCVGLGLCGGGVPLP